MEPALTLWNARGDEGWIEGCGIDPAGLRSVVARRRERFARGPGPVRVQTIASDRASTIVDFLAAVTCERPVDLFLGSPAWTDVDRAVAAALAMREPAGEADATRVMIATGGTSGGVRFAVHTWGTLAAAAQGLQTWMGGGPLSSVCFLPLHHVSGLMQLVRAFVSGGRLFLADWAAVEAGRFPVVPERAREEHRVTSVVPTQLARLLAVEGGAAWLRSFDAVYLGGGPAWPDLVAAAREARVPVAPAYGMTETAAQVITQRPAAFLAGGALAGEVLPHTSIAIVDADGRELASGEPGRVRVRGESLFHGYWPECGRERRTEFITGDRGRLDAAGRLEVLGRADALINTGGEKVDPQDVEHAIRATGLVSDATVLGVPDVEWGEIVAAVVAGCGDVAALRERLRATLAAHKRPKRIVAVDAVPRNAAGKIDREALRRIVAQDPTCA